MPDKKSKAIRQSRRLIKFSLLKFKFRVYTFQNHVITLFIFLFEFQQYLGKERSSYLIPADIESRLKSGSRKRYDEQYYRFKDIKSDACELQQLIDLIHHERKAYDQEGYICCEP